MCVN
jgi:hypothetical protein